MIYRAEVVVQNLVVDGSVGVIANTTTHAGIWFLAKDATHTFAIAWEKVFNEYTVDFVGFQEWQTWMTPLWLPDPDEPPWNLVNLFTGATPDRIEAADGGNGAEYDLGGTFAIEKDTEAETISFISPMGTLTYDWDDPKWEISSTPFPVGDSILQASAMGHYLARSSTSAEESEEGHWTDFFTYQDDEPFMGAELTSADPGSWDSWVGESFGGGGGSDLSTDDQQLSGNYQTRIYYETAHGSRRNSFREWRKWVEVMPTLGVDLVDSPVQSILWRAGPKPMHPDEFWWWRSFDGGRSWENGIIYEEDGETFESPSLTWWNGKLIAVWNRSTDILQAVSYTGARDWEMPTTLPYTGTNPRHIMHRGMGLYLYFFFDGTTLKVARSSDAGTTFWDASPVTVETGIVAQQIDAEFAFDGSVLVSWFDAGAWMQKRSFDGGLTWE